MGASLYCVKCPFLKCKEGWKSELLASEPCNGRQKGCGWEQWLSLTRRARMSAAVRRFLTSKKFSSPLIHLFLLQSLALALEMQYFILFLMFSVIKHNTLKFSFGSCFIWGVLVIFFCFYFVPFFFWSYLSIFKTFTCSSMFNLYVRFSLTMMLTEINIIIPRKVCINLSIWNTFKFIQWKKQTEIYNGFQIIIYSFIISNDYQF